MVLVIENTTYLLLSGRVDVGHCGEFVQSQNCLQARFVVARLALVGGGFTRKTHRPTTGPWSRPTTPHWTRPTTGPGPPALVGA